AGPGFAEICRARPLLCANSLTAPGFVRCSVRPRAPPHTSGPPSPDRPGDRKCPPVRATLPSAWGSVARLLEAPCGPPSPAPAGAPPVPLPATTWHREHLRPWPPETTA